MRAGLGEQKIRARRDRDAGLDHNRLVPEPPNEHCEKPPDVRVRLADQDLRHATAQRLHRGGKNGGTVAV